jgi:hypothetical protein
MDQQISGILKERAGKPLKYQDNLASLCQSHRIEVRSIAVEHSVASHPMTPLPSFSLIASGARLRRENARRSYRSSCARVLLSSE